MIHKRIDSAPADLPAGVCGSFNSNRDLAGTPRLDVRPILLRSNSIGLNENLELLRHSLQNLEGLISCYNLYSFCEVISAGAKDELSRA